MKAETIISLSGKKCVLIYDWDAICLLEKKFGAESLSDVLASQEVAKLADILECGLHKHHPEITAETLFDMSPALIECRQSVEKALSLAYFGSESPNLDKGGGVKKKKTAVKFLMLIGVPFILGWILTSFGHLPLINFQF